MIMHYELERFEGKKKKKLDELGTWKELMTFEAILESRPATRVTPSLRSCLIAVMSGELYDAAPYDDDDVLDFEPSPK